MHPPQGAIYARVSSEQQAEAHTVASQVAALRERVAADGLPVSEALQFLDEAQSGATLVRPALERLRDGIAAGSVDRLSVHSPDRLARQYASQVLLVDAFRRAGGEVVFVNRALGHSPEDDLLLPVQGMIAEYERAKIIERHRRGKRHAARVGAVNVLRGAPYGYRSVPKDEGGGQARQEIMPDAARVVRQVFAWVGHDRLTIGEVCRRLTQAGEVTRTGKTVWDRRVVWGLLKHPASQGAAACGKTRQGPPRPRLRAQRSRPMPPRRAVSINAVPPEDWITIPVPALVEPEGCAPVQEQVRENKRHARQSRRGALSLLQGVLQCQHCGSALYGKRLSPSARKGQPRAYASSRCLGTDAYRFGGERLCQHTQGRTDLLDLAVWQAVCTLLAHPERLAEAYRRRVQPGTRTKRTPLSTVESQISQVRQGVARLIDRYAEGLIDTGECEPRVTRLRQRLAHVEEQRQALADEAAVHGDLQLIIGRLEDCAATLHNGLEAADWTSKRDLIRALVKRVEVARDDVNIVFRIDPYPGDADLEKKVGNFVGGVSSPLLANLFLHYAFDVWMRKTSPHLQCERYADDALVHCRTEAEAQEVRAAIAARMQECRLELHPEKTKIVYGKDDDRRGTYPNEQFDFLGQTFRPRRSKNWKGKYFSNFSPAVADNAGKAIRAEIRHWKLHLRSDKSIEDLSRMFNPKIRGWLQYYGRQYRSALYPMMRQLDRSLARWAYRKYKKLRGHRRRATHWIARISRRDPGLFAHWQMGARRSSTVGAV